MSYLVLARKWRPQTFRDLVGQEHVAQSLRNAITMGRVAHAFLFTGARGVGKTTIARIMAKALNCLTRTGESADPCLTCAACLEIAEGRDPDVREIDGASNNGVENVRALQESLPYRPQRDRYKVVIIDEVHMLTTGAWNALLKTLEEPPPHVKFIFATTEVHKVLATILSRVQRYDFRLIPTARIRERVAYILTQEGLRYDDSAVALVAREAAGSMRDALSLLDQVIAGVEGEITGLAAAKLLGVADHKALYELVSAMLAGDAPSALRGLDRIAHEGFDLPNVCKALLGVLRDLVVARVVSNPGELLDLADEERAEVVALAAKHDAADLERLFVAWARTTEDVSRAREPRWVMEMAVVRLAHRPTLLPVEDLMARLLEMERRLASGGAPPPPTRPSGPGPAPGGGPPRSSASAAPASAVSPAPQRMAAPTSHTPHEPPRAMGGSGAATAAARPAPQDDWLSRARAQTQPAQHAAAAAVVAAPPKVAPKEPPPPELDVSTAMAAMDAWRRVVDAVDKTLVPVLKSAVPLTVDENAIRLAIDARDSFFRRKLATDEAQRVILEAATRVFGRTPTMELVQGVLPEAAPTLSRLEDQAKQEQRRIREDAAKAHPMVRAVCELLNGEVQRVRLDDDPQ